MKKFKVKTNTEEVINIYADDLIIDSRYVQFMKEKKVVAGVSDYQYVIETESQNISNEKQTTEKSINKIVCHYGVEQPKDAKDGDLWYPSNIGYGWFKFDDGKWKYCASW